MKTKQNQQDGAPPITLLRIGRIRKRADFQALKGSRRASASGFLMLARKNPENGSLARIGFTVTKKVGGAVVRNRIRRRLRAAARVVFPVHAAAGVDYVLIARKAAYDRKYAALLDDMKRALLRLGAVTK